MRKFIDALKNIAVGSIFVYPVDNVCKFTIKTKNTKQYRGFCYDVEVELKDSGIYRISATPKYFFRLHEDKNKSDLISIATDVLINKTVPYDVSFYIEDNVYTVKITANIDIERNAEEVIKYYFFRINEIFAKMKSSLGLICKVTTDLISESDLSSVVILD